MTIKLDSEENKTENKLSADQISEVDKFGDVFIIDKIKDEMFSKLQLMSGKKKEDNRADYDVF